MADAKVRIKITGGGDIIKQLQGAATAADKLGAAEKRAAKEAERLAKDQIKFAQKAAAEAEKAAKHAAATKTREDAKAAREAKRIADETAREAKRLDDRQIVEHARYQAKLTEQNRREVAKRHQLEQETVGTRRERASRVLRAAGGFMTAAVAGVTAGGMAAMNTARNVLGVQDTATRVQNANASKQSLLLTAADAGLTKEERAQAEANVNKAAMASATDPGELVAGLADAHSRFNAFKSVNSNLVEMAKTAKAQDTQFSDFVTAIGSVQSAFGLQGDQLQEAWNIMIAASQKGALNFKQFATAMAPQMGTFAANTGQTGIEGLRQFVAVMQTAATRQGGAEDAAVRGSQAITYLNRPETIDAIEGEAAKGKKAATKGLGFKIRGADGTIDAGRVIELLATNKDFQTPEQQAAIFHDAQAREGIQTLIAQRNKALMEGGADVVDYASMAGVSAEAGAKNTTDKMAALEESGLMEIQRQAVEMQVHVNEHLKDYNDQLLMVTKTSNRLEKSFGTLSLWASSIGIGGMASAGTGALLNMATGGKAGTVAQLAKLGPTVGGVAAGGARGIAGSALAVGAAGFVGYEAGTAIDDFSQNLFDKKLSTMFGEWLSSDVDAQRTALLNDGKTNDALKSEVALDVTFTDKRTEVSAKSKNGGGKVSMGAGPLMPGSGM